MKIHTTQQTRNNALASAAHTIRANRSEARREEVAGLNAAAALIDRMIAEGEGFPVPPLSVPPTPIRPA